MYTVDTVELRLLELAQTNHTLVIGHDGDGLTTLPLLDSCHCPSTSQPLTFLTPQSVLTLPNQRLAHDTRVTLTIRTSEPNGLLLFCESTSEFFSLELLDGELHLVLDLISGSTRVIHGDNSSHPLTDTLPHNIVFQARGQQGILSVDGISQTFTIPAPSSQWDITCMVHLGWVVESMLGRQLPQHLWTGMLRYGYVGCMTDLTWADKPIDLAGNYNMIYSHGSLKWFDPRHVVGRCHS